MWICPECGRKFARNRQSHSCIRYDLEDIFAGKGTRTRELFRVLTERIQDFGEMEIHPGKWSLTVRRLSTFLSVMPERDHLTLVFISADPIEEFPVYQSHQNSSHRYANAIKIESPEEIDGQLLGWLKQAWELTG